MLALTSSSNRRAAFGCRALSAACEPLERRALLSLSVAGPEFLVNSATAGAQANAAIAADADGDFVVAWESDDGSAQGIFAQRFSAAGVALGGEFRVNVYTTEAQNLPTVAVDADGDFVVAWQSANQDGYFSGVYGRRFSAAGVALGGEFRANTYTPRAQAQPVAAMDAAGNVVIAWTSFAQTGPANWDVYAQRYDASGVPRGGEFLVNGNTESSQVQPTIAMAAAGDFVVAWTSQFQETPTAVDLGIYAQRFDASGAVRGGEFHVNTVTTGHQSQPSVAMSAGGDFVIAWDSDQDGSVAGVYAQRYGADGVARGAEFRANTYTTNAQANPSAAMDADGDFLIAWDSLSQDGAAGGAFAKIYDKQGNELPRPAGAAAGAGNEFRVNAYTTGSQSSPAATLDAEGNAVIAWYGEGAGDAQGVFAQRYGETTDTAGPVVTAAFIDGTRVRPYQSYAAPLSAIVVAFSEDLMPFGANGVTNPANWLLTRNGADVSASISSISFVFNAATNRHEAVVNFAAPHTSGNFTLVARDTIRDQAGNSLDGNLDGAPGGSAALSFSIAPFAPRGGEFRVNSYTTGSQANPAIAMRPDGGYVTVWESDHDGSDSGVFGQLYDPAGTPVGAEFGVNTYTTSAQRHAAVAMDASGDFVVVWTSYFQEGPIHGGGIYGQRYSAAGMPAGPEFHINTFTTGNQLNPVVAMHHDGDFIVAWSSQDGHGSGVSAQRYDAAGTTQGTEFVVNAYTTGGQESPTIAVDASGDFVIAWESAPDFVDDDVYARRFDRAGMPYGAEFRVNTYTTGFQVTPEVATGWLGEFVLTWASHGQDGSGFGVYAQRYDAPGVPQGGEFRVNTSTPGGQLPSGIVMDVDGRFAISWQGDTGSGAAPGVFAQRYNAAGAPRGGEFRVNTFTTGAKTGGTIASDAGGDFVIAWSSDAQDGSSYGVYAQPFGADDTPTVPAVSDSPDPVNAGSPVTLRVFSVYDDGGPIAGVSFYRESNGVAGLQVGFQGDTFLVTQTQFINDAWTAVIPTAGLAGTYTYWAQATDDAGLTGTPASTANTVIPLAPVLNSWSWQYATLPQRIAYQFNQNVSASLGLDDIVVQQLPGGPTVTPSGLSYHAPTNTATFTFDTPLPDGRYRARLIAAGINGPGGPPMAADHVFEFTFLRGDANGDGRVNLADFNVLAANFGQSPRDFTQGDFDYSGNVNLSDFNLLASRFGMSAGPGGIETDPRGRGAGDNVRDRLDDLLH